VESAELAKEQLGYYEAEVKRRDEKNAQDKTQCWLRRAVTELDPASVAILRKSYAEMFECEKPQWKINMEKYIANVREREESSKDDDGSKDDKDDA
jgi:hypothetical protein